MAIEFEVETYKIPEWALPALVNSDYTALMDDDEAYVDSLFEWLDGEYGAGNWHIGDVGEQYFGRADFGGLAGEVCDVEVVYKLVEMD